MASESPTGGVEDPAAQVSGSDSEQEPVPQRLLTAATRLFAERGFETTSVQEIVDAAGVTKGAMYHYFGSKDDLLYEIYARVLRVQTARMERAVDSAESVQQRLRAVAIDVVVTTVTHLDDTVIFFRSMHLLHPDKQAEVRAQRRHYHERVRRLIEEGQSAGVFRSDRSAELVVDFFFGAVHHLGSWYRRDGPMSGQQVGEQFADLLLDALRPEPAG